MKVRDSSGKILYHTIEINGVIKVYDGKNHLLGYCENGKTRPADGKLVAYSESPGLLVGSEKYRLSFTSSQGRNVRLALGELVFKLTLHHSFSLSSGKS